MTSNHSSTGGSSSGYSGPGQRPHPSAEPTSTESPTPATTVTPRTPSPPRASSSFSIPLRTRPSRRCKLTYAAHQTSAGPKRTDDHDSAYGSDAGSGYTSSITSSIFHYQYENGRRYHAYREGQYVLPNDDQEQERLDLQHHIWRLLLGGRTYTAPLPDPASEAAEGPRVLDLGTGTGIWAIDLADEFPTADVFGVDLSPIQPEWVPKNCKFHVDDYEDDWTYREEERFDYIHGRALSGTSSDWARFYDRVMGGLKPGGWVEMQEYDAWIFSDDDSFDRAIWTKEWVTKLDDASKTYGKQINVARFHKQWMIEAGFEDVQELVYRIPIGPWAKDSALKELGRYELAHMQMSVESHTPALFTRVLGFSEDQARVLMEGVKREFRSKDYRLITSYRFITGRKPLAP
ncbi:methyltransferase domain-containing protein [Colletotrichum kahawae]|uniref:Methyltransferase domain-containing protein n=1 Tax=Colletotrichum kahawae TaxID=34407 RepID=A0AAE0D1Q8_COLKA|nr:methyltransferase domain-containing protein [Colletotrichum kahawae]